MQCGSCYVFRLHQCPEEEEEEEEVCWVFCLLSDFWDVVVVRIEACKFIKVNLKIGITPNNCQNGQAHLQYIRYVIDPALLDTKTCCCHIEVQNPTRRLLEQGNKLLGEKTKRRVVAGRVVLVVARELGMDSLSSLAHVTVVVVVAVAVAEEGVILRSSPPRRGLGHLRREVVHVACVNIGYIVRRGKVGEWGKVGTVIAVGVLNNVSVGPGLANHPGNTCRVGGTAGIKIIRLDRRWRF